VLGRELFDFAFKEYSRRWMFKRPEPADLFRTMEDASGVDLDWFWRGWFYTTDHTDIAITGATRYSVDTRDPEIEKERRRAERDGRAVTMSTERNRDLPKYVEQYPDLVDFYNTYDELDVTPKDVREYERFLADRTDEEKALLRSNLRFYVVELENLGGLPMPVILDVEYTDGTVDHVRVPAEIWRSNVSTVSKLVMSEKDVARIVLDPRRETADADESNNVWPPEMGEKRLRLTPGGGRRRGGGANPMREAQEEAKRMKRRSPAATSGAEGDR
jgi:hypothetical protein